MRARTRTVQRKKDRATENRAAAAACTLKPVGALAAPAQWSLPARTPLLPKVSGLASSGPGHTPHETQAAPAALRDPS